MRLRVRVGTWISKIVKGEVEIFLMDYLLEEVNIASHVSGDE